MKYESVTHRGGFNLYFIRLKICIHFETLIIFTCSNVDVLFCELGVFEH